MPSFTQRGNITNAPIYSKGGHHKCPHLLKGGILRMPSFTQRGNITNTLQSTKMGILRIPSNLLKWGYYKCPHLLKGGIPQMPSFTQRGDTTNEQLGTRTPNQPLIPYVDSGFLYRATHLKQEKVYFLKQFTTSFEYFYKSLILQRFHKKNIFHFFYLG